MISINTCPLLLGIHFNKIIRQQLQYQLSQKIIKKPIRHLTLQKNEESILFSNLLHNLQIANLSYIPF